MTNIDSRIKTVGAKVAKIQLEADKKPMSALFEGIANHVKTKEDIQAFLTGYAESLEHGGITTGSVKVMKSRANRIAQVMTATNKKLCEFHAVNTPEDGIKLVAELMARPKAGGITAVFEALAPKLTDQEQGSEQIQIQRQKAGSLPKQKKATSPNCSLDSLTMHIITDTQTVKSWNT
jgi:hypothetical protein